LTGEVRGSRGDTYSVQEGYNTLRYCVIAFELVWPGEATVVKAATTYTHYISIHIPCSCSANTCREDAADRIVA
jgi:hypothetical protein